jgi:hypothetical protein
VWPPDFDVNDDPDPNRQNCCYRETWNDHDRCVWHADVSSERPVAELRTQRETTDNRRLNAAENGTARSSPAELLDGATVPAADTGAQFAYEDCSLRGVTAIDAGGPVRCRPHGRRPLGDAVCRDGTDRG